MENNKKERLYNIELLRIISMLLIITTHALGHGGILETLGRNNIYYYVFNFIESFSVISVNLFVLISGYFLCKSNFKLKRVLYLVVEVFFYNIVIFLLLLSTKQITFSFKLLVYNIFPIITSKYWFVTAYFLLYIFSPFLKILVNNISKKNHLVLISISLILFCLIPSIFFFSKDFSISGGYSFIWFIVLYFVAAYIRNYVKFNKINWLIVTFVISTCLIFISFLIIDNYIPMLNNRLFFLYNSIFIFISSVVIFLIFININIKSEKIGRWINKIAMYTFSIYLIHDNDLLRNIIWTFVNYPKYLGDWGFIFIFLISIIVIFVCCLIISILMNFIVKYLYNVIYKILKLIFKVDIDKIINE